MHKRVGVMDSDTWKYEQLLKILCLYRLMEKRKRQLRTEGEGREVVLGIGIPEESLEIISCF